MKVGLPAAEIMRLTANFKWESEDSGNAKTLLELMPEVGTVKLNGGKKNFGSK